MSNTKTKPRGGDQVLVSVWMPSEVVRALDAHINSQASETNRSKFLRDTLREKLGVRRRKVCATAGGAL
jgi:metal-responsive CopG/Arc/MetJ family transcriptional regulator